jgi:hypothetical protein
MLSPFFSDSLKTRTSDLRFNRLFTLTRLRFTSYQVFLLIVFSYLRKTLTEMS